ncbi:MAG: 30S ribosome-binding factor RbfA [Myxococcota bacterium]|nr:30S ribosome-binding factor RbfA [Myxococcota bacterium]
MKRTEKHRPERLATLIQQTVADAIATKLKDPRVGFVTVTRVEVSRDGTHANLYVSVMGSEDDKDQAMEGLQHAAGFLRTHVANTLHLRTAPELHIELDRGLEHSQRIDEILQQLEDEGESS